ncbi:hypothetical protein F5884DRAFT_889273 [Xylogone sp. PMI_703]|nr:hypothetical protein F5884DRAFT_889273 [Xylogone sp. PMI_703]
MLKIFPMNIGRELHPTGSATRYGHASSSEADGSYRPRTPRPWKGDLPTVVVEAGVSEPLPVLHNKAHWWLENSNGDVRVAIIISVQQRGRIISIEKWRRVQAAGPATRASSWRHMALVPRNLHTVTIRSNPPDPARGLVQDNPTLTATGVPLTIEFDSVFLRQPVPPLESDLIFTQQEFIDFASDLWEGR